MDDRQATFVPTVHSDVRTECSHGNVRTPATEHDGNLSSRGSLSPLATDDAVPPSLRRAPRGSLEGRTPTAACGGDRCATAHGRGRDPERDCNGSAPASEPARSGPSSSRARQAAADAALLEPAAPLSAAVLQERADLMFVVGCSEPVASNVSPLARKATKGLVKIASELVSGWSVVGGGSRILDRGSWILMGSAWICFRLAWWHFRLAWWIGEQYSRSSITVTRSPKSQQYH